MAQLDTSDVSPDLASAWLLRALGAASHTWAARHPSGVEIAFRSGMVVRVGRAAQGPPVATVLDAAGIVEDAWPVTDRDRARHVARELQARERRARL